MPDTAEQVVVLNPDGHYFLTLDPVSETFEADYPGAYILSGSYDPKTGWIRPTYCRSNGGSCFEAQYNHSRDVLQDFKDTDGDGLVLMGKESYINFTADHVYGYNLSDESNLPTGSNVVYSGRYHLAIDSGVTDSGYATTTVDFDNASLTAEFVEIYSQKEITFGKLEGVEIDGVEFSGGDLSFNLFDGREFSGGETKTNGAFFGEEGQELGGTWDYEELVDGTPEYIHGNWNGVKQ